ncbi:MAG: threonylcarbamoyl-AMP synthase [Thermoplasmatales archaeon]|nr:threonylcarbamoyl-AMP synthase [Thermoplasmatales archaeon]
MKVRKCGFGIEGETEKVIDEAVGIILSGGLVVYPTETVYGIGACAFDQVAIKKVYKAKERPFDMPLSIAVHDKAAVARIAVMTPNLEKLIDAFMPGPLTIISNKTSAVPDIATSMSQKVGIRIPDHPIALELARRAGPIITTSANRHSHPDAVNVADAKRDLGDAVDLYIDCGCPASGKPSTIIWLDGDAVEIVRQGEITKEQVEDVLGR